MSATQRAHRVATHVAPTKSKSRRVGPWPTIAAHPIAPHIERSIHLHQRTRQPPGLSSRTRAKPAEGAAVGDNGQSNPRLDASFMAGWRPPYALHACAADEPTYLRRAALGNDDRMYLEIRKPHRPIMPTARLTGGSRHRASNTPTLTRCRRRRIDRNQATLDKMPSRWPAMSTKRKGSSVPYIGNSTGVGAHNTAMGTYQHGWIGIRFTGSAFRRSYRKRITPPQTLPASGSPRRLRCRPRHPRCGCRRRV